MIGAAVDDFDPPYTGIPRAAVIPVFKMACRLRFMKPDVNMLLECIDTQLDRMIISALIEAALRLLADWEVGRNGPPRLPDAYIVFV